MNWKITGCEYEVVQELNNGKELIKVVLLNNALENMSSDKCLRATCNVEIEGRITNEYKICLPYEDIAQLNEQQILALIEQETKIKFNL